MDGKRSFGEGFRQIRAEGVQEKERELRPHEVTLQGGLPLYNALLDVDPEGSGVIDREMSEEVRRRLNVIIDADPDAVLTCQGKSPEEARAILKKAEQALESASE